MIKTALSRLVKSPAFYTQIKDTLGDMKLAVIEENILGLISKFISQFNHLPTREELLLFFDELPEAEREHTKDYKAAVNDIYTNKEYDNVTDKVILYKVRDAALKQKVKEKIVYMADTFDNRTGESLVQDMRDMAISSIQTNSKRRSEADVEDTKRNIEMVKYTDTERHPTLITGLDKALYGGLGVREITTIVAPSNRGKSVFLTNLFYSLIAQGIPTLLVTLEMSVRDNLRRLYRRILYKDKDYLHDANEAEMLKWLNKFFGMSKAGGKVVYYPANSFSTNDLKTELAMFEMTGKFMPQAIIIDHLDLMTSATKSIRQKEMYAYWRLLVDDLREIPLNYDIPIITATQGTRDSSDKVLVTERDVGESYGKVQSSDVVLSLNQTADEVKTNRMRVAVIKNRDYTKGMEVEIYCDLDKMYMGDLKFAQEQGWI